jgi:hypothetical protein
MREIHLDGKTYTLIETAGSGGSSVVYRARADGENQPIVMLKEYFPYDLSATRLEDGSVSIAADMLELAENVSCVNPKWLISCATKPIKRRLVSALQQAGIY